MGGITVLLLISVKYVPVESVFVVVVLRGTIANRTYGIYIKTYQVYI